MIIYTSGTTGRPKGAMISHNNILTLTRSFTSAIEAYPNDQMLSFLPLAHIYENLISLFQAIWGGSTVNFLESRNTMGQDLREVSPTVFANVPRIWEKLVSMIEIRMSDSTRLKKILYRLSIGIGLRYVRTHKDTAERFLWGLLYWPFYGLVLYHLKRQLGLERLRYAVCGAAPASPELFDY